MMPEQFIARGKDHPLTERAGAQAYFDDKADRKMRTLISLDNAKQSGKAVEYLKIHLAAGSVGVGVDVPQCEEALRLMRLARRVAMTDFHR